MRGGAPPRDTFPLPNGALGRHIVSWHVDYWGAGKKGRGAVRSMRRRPERTILAGTSRIAFRIHDTRHRARIGAWARTNRRMRLCVSTLRRSTM